MPVDPIESPSHSTSINEKLQNDTETCTDTNFGDFYVLGKIWIDILKTGLLGTKWDLPKIIQVVEAAPPPQQPPQKPPKMRYQDLPLDECPHYDYNDYESMKGKCPNADKKLLHQSLLPHVKSYRKWVLQNIADFACEVKCMKRDAKAAINAKKCDVKTYMRHPDNIYVRQAVVVLGGLTGCLIGSRKSLSRRTFYTAVGLLAAGALCFPKETDETFRTFTFTTAKIMITAYNKYCGKGIELRERLPCKSDIPPPPDKRNVNVCSPKK